MIRYCRSGLPRGITVEMPATVRSDRFVTTSRFLEDGKEQRLPRAIDSTMATYLDITVDYTVEFFYGSESDENFKFCRCYSHVQCCLIAGPLTCMGSGRYGSLESRRHDDGVLYRPTSLTSGRLMTRLPRSPSASSSRECSGTTATFRTLIK